jgi:hypothetical protein
MYIEFGELHINFKEQYNLNQIYKTL